MLMSDVSGMDVLNIVRTFSQVPIIAFTAKPDVVEVALRNGANDSIAKPFHPDELVEKIRSLLAKANQEEPST